MRRALPLLALLLAQAANAKHLAGGWKHAQLITHGAVDVYLADKAGPHVLAVLGKRVLVVDPDQGLAHGRLGTPAVTVGPFLDDASVLDVDVTWSMSNATDAASSEFHYLITTQPLRLLCMVPGSASSSTAEATTSSTVTITKVTDQPLTWDADTTHAGSHGFGAPPPPRDRTRYVLSTKGCAGSPMGVPEEEKLP